MLRLLCLLTLTSHLLAQTGTIPVDRPRARPASALTGWADWEKGEELLKRIQVPPAPVLSAEDEAKTFKLAPGYRAELVACEPLVQCPIPPAISTEPLKFNDAVHPRHTCFSRPSRIPSPAIPRVRTVITEVVSTAVTQPKQ